MKRLHSILAGLALATLSTPAWAIQIPVTGDTAGVPAPKNTIAKAAGTATTLAISAKSTPILFFDLANSGIDSASVTGARVILYFPKVTKPGNLGIRFPAAAFQETFATATIPLPALNGSSPDTAVTTATNKGYIVLPGFKLVVQSWVANPSSNTGIALVADATLNAAISSREGAGVGAAAVLEVDVNPSGGPVVVESVTSSGDVSGGSLTTSGAIQGGAINATTVTASDAVTGGSLSTGGTLSVSGVTTFNDSVTIANNKVLTISGSGSLGVGSGGIATSGTIQTGIGNITTTSGTITAGGLIKGGSFSSTGNIAGGSFTGGAVTGTVALGSTTVSALTSQNNCVANGQMRAATLGIGFPSATANTRGVVEVLGNLTRPPNGGNAGYLFSNGTVVSIDGLAVATSIFAENAIAAQAIEAFSDARIKDIHGQSDSAGDLHTLLGLEITDYHYVDKIAKGSRPQKKVIAQQVEKVFPQAVSQRTDVVPDIYRKADISGGWVSLATDLQVGDRVRLIGAEEKEQGIYEVLEVSPDGFRTAFQPSGAEVFVYGREVKDFRSVDYEAIAMLNVSATQELAKKLAAREDELKRLRAANDALTQKLAAVEKRDTARLAIDAELQARLTRLEAASPSERPAQVTTAALEQE